MSTQASPTGEAVEIRPGIWVVDSVTRLGPGLDGKVLIGASHCGIYAAYLGAKAGLRAVVLNDAGGGLDGAGVAGLDYLGKLGVAAATVDYRSARIGNGRDCAENGVISQVNAAAVKCGVEPGQRALDAATLLLGATRDARPAPEAREARHCVARAASGREVWALDSVSLVRASDAGQIIVTGSHGGLLGGRPETAIKITAFAAFYNDAGVGKDQAGISRLPELERRGIVGATVSHQSARIGDGRSTYETGIISHFNGAAGAAGAGAGMALRDFIDLLLKR
jgi:hypothetical protein